ncbi:hypothetical protein KEM56_005749 [Ascosphaera pollenicola]|nr:hypothetical protein KEM56_005749 [Ascosphaera pollenicola]
MAEQAVLSGGRSAMKNLKDAGFSEALRKQLEERVVSSQDDAFRSDNQRAFSIASMPTSAGSGTKDIAAASPWTGKESLHDVSLRMLDDASKPIKAPSRIPNPVNLQPAPKIRQSPGERIMLAKESSQTYKVKEDPKSGLSSYEREEYARELRERFTPVARPMPMSPQGLTNLANEKIEAAITRGDFQKIKRGKGINTEHADNQYVDTTEFLMNRILKNQDVTPPWIEKQQGMTATINKFREKMRGDWLRHALFLIRKHGKSPDEQLRYARAYVAAENSDSMRDPSLPRLPQLRDESFEKTHESALASSIASVNSAVREYNLMAPPSTQRPYLEPRREWARCYAHVNPTLADELSKRQRDDKKARHQKGSQAKNEGTSKGFWSLFNF